MWKQEKEAGTNFVLLCHSKIWLGNSKETNQDSTFSHSPENSKMFNITSKFFSFFNNKPPASWFAHITRDFLTCYSCSYYGSSIFKGSHIFNLFWYVLFLKYALTLKHYHVEIKQLWWRLFWKVFNDSIIDFWQGPK